MISEKPIRIVGFGKYLPKSVLSSEIERTYGLPLGWSEKYSGVKSRHHVTFETNGYMGARAIENALEKCEMKLKNVDLILSAGATFDYILPNQASVIKSELADGYAVHIPTIDIDASCMSFVSAFEIAASLLDGKKYKNIIIVSSEVASKGLDSTNRETISLFGDGAVAVILRFDPNSSASFIKADMKTYSEGVYDSIIKGGGIKYYVKNFPYEEKLYSFSMNGKKLLRLAKKNIPIFINDFFDGLPTTIEGVTVIIPHQASKLGISILTSLYNFKEGQVQGNLSTYGNCIAASIPLALMDAVDLGAIKRGDTVFLIGTAAGFSIGGALFRY